MNTKQRFSVYWFDPEPSRGAELRKIRPCVVVSPDEMNEALRTVLVVPLTSTVKAWPFRVNISLMGRVSSVACDQLRAIDASRLKARIGDLSAKDSAAILAVLQTMFS